MQDRRRHHTRSELTFKVFQLYFFIENQCKQFFYLAIAHIAEVFNGKLINLPILFRENLMTEFKNIKERLFKDNHRVKIHDRTSSYHIAHHERIINYSARD
jgi:hypothetical protein